ncbi:MarR family winged helix-turn-helix transcriptional regulator [Salinibacterium sp.]|uniref:MarR family winged helix-turn-helix transcriptional regulator n=1 Tax=Salinibacterium sp. TaxID=1915057 RepID=UPI00286D0B85|nr:MarR family winged helix-turn-helix transcriptional regulator [Salinibacterium sp.]
MKDAEYPGEQELWRVFSAMRRQLELAMERRLQSDAAISTADFDILSALIEEPGHRLRSGRIADLIGWERSRVSHQITRMQQRGLLHRQECGDDARGVWIALSANGRRSVLGAVDEHRAAVREYFFDALTEEEKATIAEASRKVLDRINPPVCDEIAPSSAPRARANV